MPTLTKAAETDRLDRRIHGTGTGRWALALLGGSFLVGTAMTVAWSGTVDPISDVISATAVSGLGATVLAVAVLTNIAGCLVVVIRLEAAVVRDLRSIRLLFGLWAAGLAGCAAFAGNDTAGSSALPEQVHRVAAAAALTAMPLLCWQIARAVAARHRAAPNAWLLQLLVVACGVTAIGFGLGELHRAWPDGPFAAALPVAGLLERLAFAAQLAVFMIAARSIGRAAR